MSANVLSNQNLKHSGVYIGVVKDNADPDKLGRLKVVVPTYNDNTALDDLQWFDYCMPFGGYKDQGFFFIPAVGAEVVVMFPGGRSDKPLWFGCINKKEDNPGPRESTREADEDHYWQRKQIKTRIGYVMFDDKDEYILIKHNSGSFISFTKEGDIDIRSEKNINIKAGKSVNISAEKGDFSVESLHSAKLESKKGDFTIEAVKGKVGMSSLEQEVFIVAGKKIHGIAATDIKFTANDGIYNTAVTKSIHNAAEENIESYAKKQIKSQADQEMLMSSKENMVMSTNRDLIQYILKDFKFAAGNTGLIKFGKSTDVIIEKGDLNISSFDGMIKGHAKDDIILDTKKKCGIYAVKDMTLHTDEKLNTYSEKNTNMVVGKSMNIKVSDDLNATAYQEMLLSGKLSVHISSTQIVDIHAAQKIYEHTPITLMEESKVMHSVLANLKDEQMNTWLTRSISTFHRATSTYTIRAGLIFLN